MGQAYVSEFAEFMDRYMKEHPEVVEEQRHGWDFFWEPKVDLTAAHITRDDLVPDDNYGFAWPVIQEKSPDVKKHADPAGH